MALSARHVGTRVLLILALVAALLAGMVAVTWVTSQGSSTHGIVKNCTNSHTCLKTGTVGGDAGGGHSQMASLGGGWTGGSNSTGDAAIGGDGGGGH
jgi:hypothetical protein